jgi:integrase
MSIFIREKALSNGRKSIYLEYYINGKRKYEFLGLYLTKDRSHNREIMRLAENIRMKRDLEMQHNEPGFVPAFKKRLNFVDYFERQTKSKSVNEKTWGCCLKHLKDFTNGHVQFSAVNEEWLELFKNYLLSKVTANTAHGYFSKMKAAMRQAVRDKIIMTNYCEFVPNIKTSEAVRCFLTYEDLQKLAKTPCRYNEVKKAFLFACYTGLRLGDCESLTWENVKENAIHFRQKKTRGVEYLPISESVKKLIYSGLGNLLPMPESKVFNLPSRMQIVYLLREWVKEAGIKKNVTFHTSRHTFATLSLSQGVDLYTVSKLLGHRQIKTTQVYAKIVDEKLRAAVDLLPAIEVGQ